MKAVVALFRLVAPGLCEPGFVGEHDGLHAVAEVELAEEMGDVGRAATRALVGDAGASRPVRRRARVLQAPAPHRHRSARRG